MELNQAQNLEDSNTPSFEGAADYKPPQNVVEGIFQPDFAPASLPHENLDVYGGVLSASQGFLDGATLSSSSILQSSLYSDEAKREILESEKEHPFLYSLGQLGGFATLGWNAGALGKILGPIVEAGKGAGAGSLAENFASQALIANLDQSASNMILDPKTSDGKYLSSQINAHALEAMQDSLTGAALGYGLGWVGKGLKNAFKIDPETGDLKYNPEKALKELPDLEEQSKLYNPERIRDFFGKNMQAKSTEKAALNIYESDNKAEFLPSFQNSVEQMDKFLNTSNEMIENLKNNGVTDKNVLYKTLYDTMAKDPELKKASDHYHFLNWLRSPDKAAQTALGRIQEGTISWNDAFDDFTNMLDVKDIAIENAKRFSTPNKKISVADDLTSAFRIGLREESLSMDKKLYAFRQNFTKEVEAAKEAYYTNPVRNLLSSGKVINNAFTRPDGLYRGTLKEIRYLKRDIAKGGSPNLVNKKILDLVERHVKDAIRNPPKTSEGVFNKIVDFNKFMSDIKFHSVQEETGMSIRFSKNDKDFINKIKNNIKQYQIENFDKVGQMAVEKASILNEATSIFKNALNDYSKKGPTKLTTQLKVADGKFTKESIKESKRYIDKFVVKMTRAGKKGNVVDASMKLDDLNEAMINLQNLTDKIKYSNPSLAPLLEGMQENLRNITKTFNAASIYNEKRIANIFGNKGEEIFKSLLPEGERSIMYHFTHGSMDLLEGNLYYAKMNVMRVLGGIAFKTFTGFFGEKSLRELIEKQMQFTERNAKAANKLRNDVVKNAIEATKPSALKVTRPFKEYKLGAVPTLMLANMKDGKKEIDKKFNKSMVFFKGTEQEAMLYQQYLTNQTVVLKRLFPEFAENLIEENNRKIGYLRQFIPKNYNVLNSMEVPLSEKINFLDAYTAVFHPMKIVEMIGNGTVTKPQMMHFKNTNPFHYGEIKREALYRINNNTPSEVKNRIYNMFDVIGPTNLNKSLIDAGNVYNTILQQQSQQNSNLVPKGRPPEGKLRKTKFSAGASGIAPKTMD